MEYREYPFTPTGQRVQLSWVKPGFLGSRDALIGRSLRAADGNDDDAAPDLHVDDGNEDVDDLGHRPSGIRVSFETDPITDEPDGGTPDDPPSYVKVDDPQSGVGGPVPWQAEPGRIPAARTTPTSQVWTAEDAVHIGRQSPYNDTLD